jgi:hypothetical protein
MLAVGNTQTTPTGAREQKEVGDPSPTRRRHVRGAGVGSPEVCQRDMCRNPCGEVAAVVPSAGAGI